MKKIYYSKPSITDCEIRYAIDAATNGWGEHCYDYIVRFERAFEKHLDVKHAIATSSCTGALHMGLAALGIGRGDEVIMADINWIATAAPVVHLGATPIFVDILPDSWCIDPALVESCITPRTKAIVAVHLYGNLCDMDRLQAIGRKHGIPIIEDAAEAIGSVYRGRRAGSIGRFGVFSFHGTKTLTTGEGGMFVTNDTTLYEQVSRSPIMGESPGQPKQFWPDMLGFKYKMSNLQAAIGCAQLERIEDLIFAKRKIFTYYSDHLSGLPLLMNPEPEGTINGFWMPTIVASGDVDLDIDDLLLKFRSDNIDGRVFFWPLSMLPMFKPGPQNVVSYRIHRVAANLPSYHEISCADMERVIKHIRSCFPRV